MSRSVTATVTLYMDVRYDLPDEVDVSIEEDLFDFLHTEIENTLEALWDLSKSGDYGVKDLTQVPESASVVSVDEEEDE